VADGVAVEVTVAVEVDVDAGAGVEVEVAVGVAVAGGASAVRVTIVRAAISVVVASRPGSGVGGEPIIQAFRLRLINQQIKNIFFFNIEVLLV
jgi:hypothetical protein